LGQGTNDQLAIVLSGTDPDGDVDTFTVRFLDARNQVITMGSSTFNPPITTPGSFDAVVSVTQLVNFLGTCSVEVFLTDKAGNRSNSLVRSFRSCSTPVLDSAAVTVINADVIQLDLLSGDPDGNTNQVSVEILNNNGNTLRPPEIMTLSQFVPSGRSVIVSLRLSGISELMNPGVVRAQLIDTQGNRSSTAMATFTPRQGVADLQVSGLILNPSVTTAGSMVTVDLTITNRGDRTAPASMAEIRLSANTTIDSSDLLLDTLSIPSLTPGQQANGVRMVTIPQNTPGGNLFIGVIADTTNQVTESSEGNNTQSRPITLQTQNTSDTVPPTVTVVMPREGDTFLPGGTFQIVYTSSDNVGVVAHDIAFSTDGGRSFTNVAQNLSGTQNQFSFVIPQNFPLSTSQAVIRVTARDAAGNSGIGLSGRFTIGDAVPPTVSVISPVGGETLTAGTRTTILFTGMDNNAIAGFTVAFSTDGGQTFPAQNLIGQVVPSSTSMSSIVWNIPDTLQSTQTRIQVTARDRSGNMASAQSGIFTVQRPVSNMPILQVRVSFTPPPPGQVLPPSNVRADAAELRTNSTGIINLGAENGLDITVGGPDLPVNQDTGPMLLGYNVYRVQQLPDRPDPTPAEIVGDPNNLIRSVGANDTSFTDMVSTGKGDNFLYSVTSFFSNGSMSSGSQPAATGLPVIRNPRFAQGTIFIESAGSFIKDGASLVVNDSEFYPLMLDPSQAFFMVPKKVPGSPSGAKIKKVVKKGTSVRLTVRNPDGKLSVGVSFTRPQ
jgi:hypothetical protein